MTFLSSNTHQALTPLLTPFAAGTAALTIPAPKPPRFIGGAGASLQWRRSLEALELA